MILVKKSENTIYSILSIGNFVNHCENRARDRSSEHCVEQGSCLLANQTQTPSKQLTSFNSDEESECDKSHV